MKMKLLGLICVYLLTVGNCCAQYTGLEIPAPQKGKKELILKRKNYTLSFNKETNMPDWVAWRLDKKKLTERVSRKGYGFRPDPDLSQKQAVVTQDYAHSGYDRGHMCPAGDSRWSSEAMKESFYMTNICPQHPNLNGGDWHELEQACRRWASEGPVYIVCGPILYKKSSPQYIGKEHRIRVPEAFFKVILAGVEKGKPKAIGFIYKNTAGNRSLDSYVNSIDQVERITGLDFFSALPDKVENAVEKEYKMKDWK
ncbi:MAG: DNA/RNA non-specific endonuclease [Bacteroides sp.]|nr:DNA/RNA non-specific endonuclease [Bacteroides sp.]